MSLHIASRNMRGEAYLVLTQGDIEETINLTGAVDSFFDISKFATGKITMCFLYEDAGEVKVDVELDVYKNEKEAKSHEKSYCIPC